ncbi:UNVERIFIED_CONTAM: hypothetical protein FOS11_37560, partial [Bacillus thuringiensis]
SFIRLNNSHISSKVTGAFAERVNKLTEDEPKLNGLAGNLDKKMNPELYSEQEQQQEQQKNQKRDRGMHL